MNQINYASREFQDLKESVLKRIQDEFPDKWSDLSESNAGMVLIDAIAFVNAIQSWNIDFIANESFISSARLRNSVLKLAEFNNYKVSGKRSSTVIADATLDAPATGPYPVVIRKGSSVQGKSGLTFEVSKDFEIDAGNTTPVERLDESKVTSPSNIAVDFVSGSSTVRFSSLDSLSAFSLLVAPGMFVRPKNSGFDTWTRVVGFSDSRNEIRLDKPWNSKFEKSFVIRTQNNDTLNSTIVLSSVPYGSFPSLAKVNVGSKKVEFSQPLNASVVEGLYFRLNEPNNCEFEKFFRIASISSDRKVIQLQESYGPLNEGGFDSKNSVLQVENRSIILNEGETRVQEFVSNPDQEYQSFTLLNEDIEMSSLQVFDEDGVADDSGDPLKWDEVDFLSKSKNDLFRSYAIRLLDNDKIEVRFGNGVMGKIPTGTVSIHYRVSSGSSGNVDSGDINTKIEGYQGVNPKEVSLYNVVPGRGGFDSETVDQIRESAPASINTLNRAVTVEDYIYLLTVEYMKFDQAVGEITLATVNEDLNVSPNGANSIFIYCWTQSEWTPPSSPDLKYFRFSPIDQNLRQSAEDWIQDYKMISDRPFLISGDIDEAVVKLDFESDPTFELSEVRDNIQESLIKTFNSDDVLNRQPVLISDVYGSLESVNGVKQVRLKRMYLDYEDADLGDNSDLDDSFENLRDVNDLYPRNATSIVSLSDLKIVGWNRNLDLVLYVSGDLYSSKPSLAKEVIRTSLHDLVFNKSPQENIKRSELIDMLDSLLVVPFQILEECEIATDSEEVNDFTNVSLTTIDGVNIDTVSRILIKDQSTSSQNGVYTKMDSPVVSVVQSGGPSQNRVLRYDIRGLKDETFRLKLNDTVFGVFTVDTTEVEALQDFESKSVDFGSPLGVQSLENNITVSEFSEGVFDVEFINNLSDSDLNSTVLENTISLRRSKDANDFSKINAGSYIEISGGSVNQNKSFFLDSPVIAKSEFESASKVFSEGDVNQSKQSIKAVTDPDVKFDSPISSSTEVKLGKPDSVYKIKTIEIE